MLSVAILMVFLIQFLLSEELIPQNKVFNGFSNRNCDGDYPWWLADYKTLGIIPLVEGRARCIQATSKSCATSDEMVFQSGVIEMKVYLHLISNDSGLEVNVYDQNNVPVLHHKYDRFSKGYIDGWNKLILHLEEGTVGYLNLKAATTKGEIILIDSYEITHKETSESENKAESLLNPNEIKLSDNSVSKSINNHWPNEDLHIETNRYRRSDILSDDLTTTTEEPEETGVVSSTTVHTSTSDVTDTEGEGNTTTESTNTTESVPSTPGSENGDDTGIGDDTGNGDDTSSGDKSFWNILTITLVSVGGIVVLLIIIVSAYHCGKMRATVDHSSFIIEEDVKPEPIIPRVKGTIYA